MSNSDPTTGVDSLGKALRRNLSFQRIGQLAGRMFATLRERGFQAAAREAGFRYQLATHGEVWKYRADIPLKRELKQQRKAVFEQMPLVSVVVPMYNTPENHLVQLIKSVEKQSYQNWELILADGSDNPLCRSSAIAAKAGVKDMRIRYINLAGNLGISGNTNAGFGQSKGSWITLLDHDDVIQPNALYEIVKAINETGADLIYSDEVVLDGSLKRLHEFHFKPDYAPDTLRGCNYITHLCAFSFRLLESVGGKENPEYDGAQDFDLILRLSEKAQKIVHIPKVLYFWRRHEQSTASGIEQKPQALMAGKAAVQSHLERVKLEGEAQAQKEHSGSYRVDYKVWGNPLVSILIPSKDHTDDLERCLDSLYKYAGWENFEVLVLDNNSSDPVTEAFYEQAEKTYPNLHVHRYRPKGFNFAGVCNFGASRAKGSQLLLLNNDLEVIGDNFISEMLCYSQRPDVGAVGAMLYYPDDTVQHAGLIIGIGGTAGVSHKGHPRGNGGDMFRLCTTQNVSAVTGAALMVKKSLYEQAGGMDEENFAVAFNDVDFCLKLRNMGLWNVFTPFAQAYHYESKSRGYDVEGEAKTRFDREAAAFRSIHRDILENGDPFYNPHFTLKTENFALK